MKKSRLKESPAWLRKYNAPLAGPILLVICMIPLMIAFSWIALIVPLLSAHISVLEDGHPYIDSILQTFIRFMFLPAFFFSQFLMIHLYQRHYDRKKAGKDASE